MALVHESTTTPDATFAAGVTFNMPATRPDDDLFIACLVKDDIQEITYTGWTRLDIEENASTHHVSAYYRVGSSEPATYNFTWTGSEPCVVSVLRFSGSTNVPVGNGSNANSSSCTAPALSTTPASDSIIVRLFGIEDDNPGSNPPSGHTEVAQVWDNNGGQDLFFSVCTSDTLGDAGAATYGGTYADNWGAISIEIPAAAAAGGDGSGKLTLLKVG